MSQSIAAELLREAREQAAMSQGQLANAAGTYQSVVGRIEAGTSSPSLETLSRLVRAAGFELTIALDPIAVKDPLVEALKADIDQAKLIENLRMSVTDRLRANMKLDADSEEG